MAVSLIISNCQLLSSYTLGDLDPIDRLIYPNVAYAGSEITDLPPSEISAEEQGLDVDVHATLPPSSFRQHHLAPLKVTSLRWGGGLRPTR